eukprot:4798320-Lingulodinium_polyedra.AAC.1
MQARARTHSRAKDHLLAQPKAKTKATTGDMQKQDRDTRGRQQKHTTQTNGRRTKAWPFAQTLCETGASTCHGTNTGPIYHQSNSAESPNKNGRKDKRVAD